MNPSSLHDMSVDVLVEHFLSMALKQDKALLLDEITKYNRLYDEMEVVEGELKIREGDQRRALLPLLGHANVHVRLKAAIATLAVDLKAAQEALHKISDRDEYPQAAEARGVIQALDEGRVRPS